jgi:tetratricopeptide (TPR) repeat protein
VYARYHSWRAETAQANDDCAHAVRHLEKCLTFWKGSARHHFEAARCCWREELPAQAEAHLREAARLGWPAKEVDVETVLVAAQQGMTPVIEKSLGDLLQFARDSRDAQLEAIIIEALILAFVRAERDTEARFMARFQADHIPETWRTLWLTGRAHQRQAPEIAAKAYRHSLGLNANQPKVHRWLAIYCARGALATDALRHFRGAQPVASDDAEALLAAAKAHYLLGEFRQAQALLDRVLARTGERQPWALALQGLVALEEQGSSEAATWMAKAEALAPYHPEVVNALVLLATHQGDVAKARVYQQRQQRQREAGEEIGALGKKMEQLHRLPHASAAEKQEIGYRLGTCLFEIGEDEAAVRWLEFVLAENPEHIQSHQSLAEHFQRSGDLEKARMHRRSANQSNVP